MSLLRGQRGGLLRGGLSRGSLFSGYATLPAFDFAPALDKAFTVDGSGNVTLTTRKGPGVAFSRASGATFTDSDGRVKYAPENLATVFSSGWASSRSSFESGQDDAFGGTAGTKLVEDGTASNSHYCRKTLTAGQTVGRIVTFSVYAKAAERSQIALANNFSGGLTTAVFNLLDGSVVSQGASLLDAGSVDEGNGWWRVWIRVVSGVASASELFDVLLAAEGNTSYSGDGSSGAYVCFPHLARSSALDDLIRPATSQIFTPSFEHDPVTGECLGLLIEEQRTNLWLRSNDPAGLTIQDPAAQGSTLVLTSGISNPMGGNSALVWTPADSSSRFFQTNIAAGTNTMSVWVRVAAGTATFRLSVYNNTDLTQSSALFTATTEWQRFTFTATTAIASSWYIRDTASVLQCFGFQVEAGAFASSLIPTNGASATRSADVLANVAVTNDGHGTLVATLGGQFPPSGSYSPKVRLIYSGGGGTRIGFGDYNSAAWSEGFVFSYSGAVQYQSSAAAGRKCSLALAFAADDVRFAYNGALGALDVSAEIPDVDRLQFGSSRIFSRVRYYNKRLPDAKLQTLTAP